MSMIIRATIRMHGEVQDVTFRPIVKGITNQMGIKGTIENRDDGSALLVCEAQKQDIELFVEKIKKMDAPTNITDIQVEYTEATGEYKMFRRMSGDIQEEILNAIIADVVILERYAKRHQVN